MIKINVKELQRCVNTMTVHIWFIHAGLSRHKHCSIQNIEEQSTLLNVTSVQLCKCAQGFTVTSVIRLLPAQFLEH